MHIKIEYVKSPILNKYSTFTILLIDESDAFKTLRSGDSSSSQGTFQRFIKSFISSYRKKISKTLVACQKRLRETAQTQIILLLYLIFPGIFVRI